MDVNAGQRKVWVFYDCPQRMAADRSGGPLNYAIGLAPWGRAVLRHSVWLHVHTSDGLGPALRGHEGVDVVSDPNRVLDPVWDVILGRATKIPQTAVEIPLKLGTVSACR
jgi:hypothetical protein